MSNRASHSSAHRAVRAVLAGAAAVVAAWSAPAGAQTIVVPHLGAAAAWTDNITLAPPGLTSNGEIWQLLPGIYLKHDSQELHATLDYELQEYFFSGGEHGHRTFQTGNLYADGQVVPDWFFVDLGGARSQVTVDPALNPAINTLFPTGNLANQTNASVTPIIRHKFDAVALDAEYSWGFARYQPVGTVTGSLPDADNRSGSVALSNADPNARISFGASYLRQETTYTNLPAPRWLYESAMADLGWLVSPELRLLGHGGKESNPLDPLEGVSNGGLGATSWSAGFDWNPDTLSELKLTAGRRFFGNTYQALARHQSRLLTLQASYSEGPTTNPNRFLPPAQALVVIPGAPTLQRLTPDVYVLKSLDARAALTGRVTEVGLELTYQEQNYLTLNGVATSTPVADQLRGATLYLQRRLGAELQGVLSASASHFDLREAGTARYNDKHYTARLNDQLGLRTTLSLTVDHWQRSGLQTFRVNMVTLNFNMNFGNGPTGAFPNAPIVPNQPPGPAVPAAVARAGAGPPATAALPAAL